MAFSGCIKLAGYHIKAMGKDSGQGYSIVPGAGAPPTEMPPPRWDGSRVLFEILSESGPVSCAISRGALEELAGRRQSAGVGLIQCFEAARARIEAIAQEKHLEQPDRVGTLSIWADDVEEPVPDATDAAGAAATSARA